jgi:hypothetical protein
MASAPSVHELFQESVRLREQSIGCIARSAVFSADSRVLREKRKAVIGRCDERTFPQ